MYIHIYVHIHIYIHKYIYIYTNIYTHTYIYTHKHICIYTYLYTHIYIHTQIYTYIYIYICTYIEKHMYTYIYIYIYTYIYRHIYIYVSRGHGAQGSSAILFYHCTRFLSQRFFKRDLLRYVPRAAIEGPLAWHAWSLHYQRHGIKVSDSHSPFRQGRNVIHQDTDAIPADLSPKAGSEARHQMFGEISIHT